MPPKKRARRDDVATGGLPPTTPPTEVNKGKKGPKRTRKQSENDTVKVLPNIDYELLAKEIVNQQKADSEKQNISESVGQPPMVNSVEDTAPVVGEAIPAAATIPASAAATIPASALGTLLDNVFTDFENEIKDEFLAVHTIPGSTSQRCLPDETIDIGTCSLVLHWLSECNFFREHTH